MLTGHTYRVVHLTPDARPYVFGLLHFLPCLISMFFRDSFITAAGDETIRFWRGFQSVKKESSSRGRILDPLQVLR